jgi:hypothetical protein
MEYCAGPVRPAAAGRRHPAPAAAPELHRLAQRGGHLGDGALCHDTAQWSAGDRPAARRSTDRAVVHAVCTGDADRRIQPPQRAARPTGGDGVAANRRRQDRGDSAQPEPRAAWHDDLRHQEYRGDAATAGAAGEFAAERAVRRDPARTDQNRTSTGRGRGVGCRGGDPGGSAGRPAWPAPSNGGRYFTMPPRCRKEQSP